MLNRKICRLECVVHNKNPDCNIPLDDPEQNNLVYQSPYVPQGKITQLQDCPESNNVGEKGEEVIM